MTTAERLTQTSKTVSVQDMKLFSLGQRSGVLSLGGVVTAFCIAGPSPAQDLLLTITGLNLATDTAAVVLVQPRSVNQGLGFSDEFAVQVLDTSATELLVRIHRVDLDSGWGQDLRLDIFIVDSVSNP